MKVNLSLYYLGIMFKLKHCVKIGNELNNIYAKIDVTHRFLV